MEWGVWVSIASICAAGAMSPGPSLAVVVRNTVQGGRAQGVMTGIGHGLGVGGYAVVAVLGLAVFFEAFPTATRAVELAGAGYLVWLGIAALRHAGQGDMGLAEGGSSRGFMDGMAIALMNPKLAVFFVALLGPLIPQEATTLERMGVAGLAMMIDGCWYVFAATVLATPGASGWLARQGVWVDRVLSLTLFSVAAWLVFR